MAKCDEGYLCDVCGKAVDEVTDSELYLRYILREVRIEELNTTPERHLRCSPIQAQFIIDERFPPVELEGVFDKRLLDESEIVRMEQRASAAYRRLLEVVGSELPVSDYPLEPSVLRDSDE